MKGEPADAALACLRGEGEERHRGPAFSSDLSVDEAILLKETGYEPRGVVVGCSVFAVNLQVPSPMRSYEVADVTNAMYGARESAMRRLRDRGAKAGGEGIIGVRLEVRPLRAAYLVEFAAIGTAIARPGRPPEAGRPFTSDLSGQDFYLLRRAGFEPLGMVMGTCVYHVARMGAGGWASSKGRNVELTPYTEALYEARELAMMRMQEEAGRLGAAGIVGVDLRETSHAWGGHTIEFFAVGTAVRAIDESRRRLDPAAVASMDDADPAAVPRSIVGDPG